MKTIWKPKDGKKEKEKKKSWSSLVVHSSKELKLLKKNLSLQFCDSATSKNLAKLGKFILEKERIPTRFFLREKSFFFFPPLPWGNGGGGGGVWRKKSLIFSTFSPLVGSVIFFFAVSSYIWNSLELHFSLICSLPKYVQFYVLASQ